MFDIAGFDSSYKVPVFALELNYAAGPIVGEGALDVLLCGMATTAGNIVANSEIRQVFQQSDVDTAGGAGSQLSVMGRAGFAAIPAGANLFVCAVAEPSGVQSTTTLTFTGTWTVGGSFTLGIDGRAITVSVGASDSTNNVATNVAAAVNGLLDCPFTASPSTNVVTLTCRQKGAQGNQWVIVQDVSLAPSGFVSTIAGSSTLHSAENGVTAVFSGAALGTGVEDVTTILTKLTTKRWARIAPAQNDAANAALWRGLIRQQLAPLVQKYNMAVFGHNGTQSQATSLAQTTLNDPNCQVVAMRYSEKHPCEIAAGVATVRAATEGSDPVPDYDGYDCSAFLVPNRFLADSWLNSEANALLNAGVTPVHTDGGVPKVVRAITSYCLLGTGQDERCLDIGDAVFPAYAAIALQNLYWGQFRAANKYVRDNPLPQEPEPPSGVGFPRLWESTLKAQGAAWVKAGWVQDTFSGDSPQYPIGTTFNKAAQRIQSSWNIVVSRVQHQLGQIINQTGPG